MSRRAIGDRRVNPVGLGAMRLSYTGDIALRDAVDVILTALDAGVELIDTADVYGPVGGHNLNELTVRAALDRWGRARDSVMVSTKGGHRRGPDGAIVRDGRPEALRAACEQSLLALGVDCIDLYQYHGVDPAVPLVESIGALDDLRREGKIAAIGLSNVGRRQLAEAIGVAPIASVQNECSPLVRASLPVAEACADAGITFACWSPGAGRSPDQLAAACPPLARIGRRHGVSAYVAALAWALDLGPHVIVLAGMSHPAHVDALDSLSVAFDDEDRSLLADPAPEPDDA